MNFSLDKLIDLQEVDGSWLFNSAFIALLSNTKISKNVPDKFAAGVGTPEERKTLWATAIALYLLEECFNSRKGEWKRIAAKGSKFLKSARVTDKSISSFI